MPRHDQCKWVENQCIAQLRLHGLSRLSTVHRQWSPSALIWALLRGRAASASSDAEAQSGRRIRPWRLPGDYCGDGYCAAR